MATFVVLKSILFLRSSLKLFTFSKNLFSRRAINRIDLKPLNYEHERQ